MKEITLRFDKQKVADYEKRLSHAKSKLSWPRVPNSAESCHLAALACLFVMENFPLRPETDSSPKVISRTVKKAASALQKYQKTHGASGIVLYGQDDGSLTECIQYLLVNR